MLTAHNENVRSMSDSQFDVYFAKLRADERRLGLKNVERCDRSGWCKCADTTGAESYYEAQDFRHGFFHDPALGGCGRITQTG